MEWMDFPLFYPLRLPSFVRGLNETLIARWRSLLGAEARTAALQNLTQYRHTASLCLVWLQTRRLHALGSVRRQLPSLDLQHSSDNGVHPTMQRQTAQIEPRCSIVHTRRCSHGARI